MLNFQYFVTIAMPTSHDISFNTVHLLCHRKVFSDTERVIRGRQWQACFKLLAWSNTLSTQIYHLLDWIVLSCNRDICTKFFSIRHFSPLTPYPRYFGINLLRAKLWTVIQCPGHDGKLQPHRVNILPYGVWDLACWW